MNLRYLGLPVRAGRLVALALGIAFLAAAVLWVADPTIGLSFGERRAALALGVLAGTLVGFLAQYVVHAPVSRKALVPGGSIGAIVFLLFAASQSNDVADHGTFVMASVARAVLFTLGLRLLIDAARGPLTDIPHWAMPLKEPELPQTLAPEPPFLQLTAERSLVAERRRNTGSQRVLSRDEAAVANPRGKSKIG